MDKERVDYIKERYDYRIENEHRRFNNGQEGSNFAEAVNIILELLDEHYPNENKLPEL